jgi:UDP-N-acetylmuramate--alanine ligase
VAAAVNEGVSLEDCRRALGSYQGVGRRFQSLGQARGVEVIDDFAHNPAKLAAAIAAAHLRAGRKGVRPAGAGGTSDPADAGRVLAVYQPHGFAPTRMLKNELIEAFTEALGPEDRLWLPDIYYVGGTTAKDISSRDVVEPLQRRGRKAFHVPRRADIVGEVAAQARAGDVVLVMGARDPSLSDFAHDILRALSRADKTAA